MEDRITVIEPNGVRRSRPLTPEGLTIGRGSDSDLVINYTGASRHHARIMFDGNSYYVIDLGSTNGTYLQDAKLAPNVPERWTPGQTLRIGDILFQLEYMATQPQVEIAGENRTTSPDHLETRVGWTAEDVTQRSGSKRQASRLALIVAIVAIFLCLIAAAVAGAYFLF